MEEQSEREDIIITKVDKSGAVVIVAVKDYKKEVERQLNHTKNTRKNYKKTTRRPNSNKNGINK